MQVQQTQVPHKHSEVIKKWADGYPIQFKKSDEVWKDLSSTPFWDPGTEYRVKPDKTTEIIGFALFVDGKVHPVYPFEYEIDIKIEFEIKDGRIVGAKVLGG